MTEPRIPPLTPREWPPEMRDALAAIWPPNPRHPRPEPRDDRPKGLNVLGTFAQHPELAAAYQRFNGHVLFATSLSERQRELLILRVAAVRDCAYEWAQHVVLAADAGLGEEEIARIREGADADGWSTADAALLRAVDELVGDACIGEETWTALSADLDTHQLMDLVFTVGAYDLLAMAMRSFGIELDDDLR